MRSDGRLGRVIGGFLVVVHMEISAKKRASYAEALEIIKKEIVGLLIFIHWYGYYLTINIPRQFFLAFLNGLPCFGLTKMMAKKCS
jgi:hypothetical protein